MTAIVLLAANRIWNAQVVIGSCVQTAELAVAQGKPNNINRVTGQIHYTIRPLQDMPLSLFISLLQQLSAYAVRTFDLPTRQVK